jgi:hypothetical protein
VLSRSRRTARMSRLVASATTSKMSAMPQG